MRFLSRGQKMRIKNRRTLKRRFIKRKIKGGSGSDIGDGYSNYIHVQDLVDTVLYSNNKNSLDKLKNINWYKIYNIDKKKHYLLIGKLKELFKDDGIENKYLFVDNFNNERYLNGKEKIVYKYEN